MTPMNCPLPMPLWLRMALQDRWDAVRLRLLAVLGGVDEQRAVEMVCRAEAGEHEALEAARYWMKKWKEDT